MVEIKEEILIHTFLIHLPSWSWKINCKEIKYTPYCSLKYNFANYRMNVHQMKSKEEFKTLYGAKETMMITS